MMLSRRTFFKLTGASTIGWYAATRFGWVQRALAQIPGGTLDPTTVPKYRAPLLIPPVMPRAATITLPGGKPADYYEISMKQFKEQILPSGFPGTTVWGYGAVKGRDRNALLIHNAPSLTIEAQWKRPVRIKWINDLKDANGQYLPHLLPVDQTLHWANPPGGESDRDTRPTFAETPGSYTGPVPIVTHVHGAVGVGRRERRLRRGMVPARRERHPRGLRDGGHLVRLLQGQGREQRMEPRGGRDSPPFSTRTRTVHQQSGTTTTPSG